MPQLPRAVQLQLEQDAEAVAQGAGQLPGAGGGTHQREPGQIDADALDAGTLADHDVEGKILQRGVKDLLHLTGQAVDLVNTKDIALLYGNFWDF